MKKLSILIFGCLLLSRCTVENSQNTFSDDIEFLKKYTDVIVLGKGKTGPYRRLARRFGVEQHIAFLGSAQNVQDVLSCCHVGVLPTFYDPSSRFILEALAAGKPVITTRFNGAVDHFVDGRHGRVVTTPEDTEALAQAIAHFATTANLEKAAAAIIDDNLKENISTQRVARESAKG